jgi:hypothetical protein
MPAGDHALILRRRRVYVPENNRMYRLKSINRCQNWSRRASLVNGLMKQKAALNVP